ncbi:hypothetical protein [Planococcus sp. NCCP-2050]|uniref:hypothetical protein n=1 Tax=Planococcus sp. NCCP-2050 TaxID=2944679 RepID=UPI00203BD708|nr:hypothetical protein [Planococcus sp. NCCP-2050]GKW47334.1 hypothetical protein NCCP2050_30260 [Planococcus sp. NCCP-2050]
MISEIKGKISSTGSNLSDRLEDKLTGDFFGALRYLPFEQGLKGILEEVEFTNAVENEEWVQFLNRQSGFDLDYRFWPRHSKGEIDLLLEFEDTLVGIEVKYRSGISSEDSGEIVSYDQSLHQLSKYSHMMESLANTKRTYLIFLAPFPIQNLVQQGIGIDFNIASSVPMGFINWEDIHTKLVKMESPTLEGTPKYILSDVRELLEVKGLKRFNGFENLLEEVNIHYSPYKYEGLKTISKSSWAWPDYQFEEENNAYVYHTNKGWKYHSSN